MKQLIDILLTSCGRFDLLRKTLESFFTHNDYPVNKLLIHDDYGMNAMTELMEVQYRRLRADYSDCQWIGEIENQGQIVSLDKLYEQMGTEYVLTLEDDFEFYAGGFIERSISILKENAAVINVSLRSNADIPKFTNSKVYKTSDGVEYYIFPKNFHRVLSGFNFNPSVRRLSDWPHRGYGSITSFNLKRPHAAEVALNKSYAERGYVGAIIKGSGYCRHIGDKQHVNLKFWKKQEML